MVLRRRSMHALSRAPSPPRPGPLHQNLLVRLRSRGHPPPRAHPPQRPPPPRPLTRPRPPHPPQPPHPPPPSPPPPPPPRRLHQPPGTTTAAAPTRDIGVSPRRLSQLFREQIGDSPKLYCRIQRFQQAVQLIHRGADIHWAELALTCGYYDQSHFANDFHA